MTETTRAIANLPALDVELVHDRTDDGSAERVAIRITGKPDLKTAAKMVEPHLLNAALRANPLFAVQAQMVRQFWQPWLAMNPFLRPLLPPPDRQD